MSDLPSELESLNDQKLPGAVTIEEWCDYWLNDKRHWRADDCNVGDVLPDLKAAAEFIQRVKAILPRILTALAAPAVKPFEWFVCGKSWYAITPFGNYNIDREGSRFKWHVCFDEMHDEHEGEAPTLEAAQSAAWAHWSERIGGALTKGSDDE